MQKIKRIPYGKGDFEAVNADNDYYVDKTMYIPLVEATPFVFLIRPRRFGKTLFLSMLESYYDVRKADRFEEFYQNTWILENPTEERGKFLILYFNFSAINKDKDVVQDNFNNYCVDRVTNFLERYKEYLPEKCVQNVLSKSTGHEMLQSLVDLKELPYKIYLLIDEYDNFTNEIIANYGKQEYQKISKEEGYFKLFFVTLKSIASGSGAALGRMFITGVSPVTMDDVTSGFNIGTNISTNKAYNEILGLSEQDVSDIIDYYSNAGVFHLDKEECMQVMQEWYDNYKFAPQAESRVYNTDMILYFMMQVLLDNQFPENLIDDNCRYSYEKLQHLVTVNGNVPNETRLNGNFSQLEKIIATGATTAVLKSSFPQDRLTDHDNFISLLYYFGLLTIDKPYKGQTRFIVPNKVIEHFITSFIPNGYMEACKVNVDQQEMARKIAGMAYDRTWQECIDYMADTIKRCVSVRDLIEGERIVQALITSLFYTGRPFLIDTEQEASGGFYDIALEPFFATFPDVPYGYFIEMKYLKASDQYDDAIRDRLVETATEQLEKYAADEILSKRWKLPPFGETKLIKLVLIFRKDTLVHSCEV